MYTSFVLKRFTGFIVILSLLSFQFSELLLYVSFKINQDFIARELCVEKDVEGSTCKGCCQLKKKIAEQKKTKKELPFNENEKQNINFCITDARPVLACCPTTKQIWSIIHIEYSFLICYSIFHPPDDLI